MREYKVKDMIGDMEAIDLDESGFVKVAFNRVNIKDLDGDVIVPQAYTKTLKERGENIFHLTDHVWKFPNSFIGKPKVYIEGDYLVGETNIDLKTNPHGAFMHARYMNGEVNQHSIGFQTIKQQSKGDYNEITELMLLEGSAVLWGANPDTPTFMAKSFCSKEDIMQELEDMYSEFRTYLKTGLSVEDTLFFGRNLEQLYTKIKNFEMSHSIIDVSDLDRTIVEGIKNTAQKSNTFVANTLDAFLFGK